MSRIILTILGTTAGVPTRERAHSAIHLSHDDGGEFSCLFDCGEGTQRQMLIAGLSFTKMDNIFITHWHGDHCLGLGGLIDTMGFEERTRPLNVYGPGAKRQMRRYLGFVHLKGNFPVRAHDVRAKGALIREVMRTDKFKIVSSPVKHSVPAVSYALLERDKVSFDKEKAAALGLPEEGVLYGELKKNGKIKLKGRVVSLEDVTSRAKGKKVVFSGDTEMCDNLKAMAHGADLLVQDCTYFEPDGTKSYMHAYFSEIKEMAEEENVKRVILTHIGRKYRDAGQLRAMIGTGGRFELAEDFMKVVI